MKLSTKSRHAVTAMLGLAVKNRDNPVVLSDISGSQGISTSYLEQLFSKLRKAKLVEGVRGPGGGYRLCKLPNEISIAQIISAVDEPIDSKLRSRTTNYRSSDQYLANKLWEDLSFSLHDFLDGIMLADFVKSTVVKRISVQQNSTSNQINRMFLPVPKVTH